MPLSEQQQIAIESTSDNNLLLAGPGTGKSHTILGYIDKLINHDRVDPLNVLVVTFTRAATNELKEKIQNLLGANHVLPHIYTLHSFSLRQLLRNINKINSLPTSFSIADDYEERQYIMEDLKRILNISHIKNVIDLFNLLSSNWETLNADHTDWESSFDNPEFLGTWREHREIFGYILRSELVYQLKKALEEIDDFNIENEIEYLIVDEYQDLNRCDLKVVQGLNARGAKIFAAGDDDQSIYGFRYAYPEGIRNFTNDVTNSSEHTITECHRCDSSILRLSMNVIRQDPRRIPKRLNSVSGQAGTIALLRFPNQFDEANKIAELIDSIKEREGYDFKDFLILLRSDRYRVFSKVLKDAFDQKNIVLNIEEQRYSIFDKDNARKLVGIIKYLENPNNDLAIRTILSTTSRIGIASIDSIIQICKINNKRFHQIIDEICEGKHTELRCKNQIIETMNPVKSLKEEINATEIDFSTILERILDLVKPDENADEFCQNIRNLITEENINSFETFTLMISDIIGNAETPDEDQEGVRIMTMHRAKGLTAKVVFIIAVEEEYLPGRGELNEERRLLYVSLTRAKHYLFLTYCNQRTGQQSHTGYTPNNRTRRTLSRFIGDLPEPIPTNGNEYNI